MNGLRKCGIYIQWNFIQSQRMKFYHLQVNEWNWRTSVTLVTLKGGHAGKCKLIGGN
jgi:hypothetical protein